MYEQIAEDIIRGRRLNRSDDVSFLIDGDLDSLRRAANRIREALCGNRVDLCTIINGRSGGCSENCKFCAQSAHNHTGAQVYSFLSADEIVAECKKNEKNGAHKFSIVTAGRSLSAQDFDRAVHAYHRMQECGKQAFFSGANATITGEMLTTSGNNTEMDRTMLTESGFDISRAE